MEKLLEVKGLKKYFNVGKKKLHAVDDINFDIYRGETLGIVGESGCGKSTTGRAILRLHEPTAGELIYEGVNILELSNKEMREYRSKMQIIFQDPYSSLNPRKSVYQTIEEPLIIHNKYKDKEERHRRVSELMEIVGLSARYTNSYPHELDGGRRQRIVIARALANEPDFIVCDEPVSALDVSIQAQILNLLKKLQEEFGITYMFITHDLSVVRHISDRIAVMYLGEIVEFGDSETVFNNPIHPYTQALFSAIPIPKLNVENNPIILKGEISSPVDPGDECRFCKRCIHALDVCFNKSPELVDVGQRQVRCHRHKEIMEGKL